MPSNGPLAGVRVLDLARVLAGPFAAMLLADLGAEVIKVERPGTGDDTRSWGPPFAGPEDSRQSTYFLSVNRGKRSVMVDLKDPAERGFVEELVRWADVLVENFRPGVMDRLGLGDESLAELNPGLVRLSISGFGDSGPDRDRVGYDQIVQAEGGLMSMTGLGHATKVGVPIADVSAGLFGVIGVLGALVERGRTGKGQRVATSLLAAQAGIHTFQATRYLIAGEVPGPSGNHHPTVAPYGLFQAADGPLVIAVGNDDIWWRFAPLVGLDPADGRFAVNATRLARLEELHQILAVALAARPVADWLALLADAGVPAGRVKSLDAVYDGDASGGAGVGGAFVGGAGLGSADGRGASGGSADGGATGGGGASGLVWEVDHPALGRVRLSANPLNYSRTVLAPGLPPPLLGEHTSQVRQAMLGNQRADAR